MSAGTLAKAPLRVAILDHTARLGGGEIALLNLARHIDATRFSLLVILFGEGPLVEKLRQAGVRTIVVPLDAEISETRKDDIGGKSILSFSKLRSAGRFVRRLALELGEQQIQLVHTNSLKSDLLGGLAARWAGIPLLWHIRDRIAGDYLPKPVVVVFRILTRLIPHRVVTNSYSTLSTLELLGPGGVRPSENPRFAVIHDGAEVGPLPAVLPDAGRLTVGLVGRISPWKGQHIFLRAIKLIRDQFPSARFQIIGSALFSEHAYEQEVRALSSSLGLEDIVEFLGFRSDVQALVDRMDLLVHASTIGEPFGQVILEGMAAGKAVVATRGGGVPEFVRDKVTGLLVPMNDAPALAAAMTELLADGELRRCMGQRAREQVLGGFTIEHTAGKVMGVYERMVSGNFGEKHGPLGRR
jgi:glycosyltransferase involved in cell wall biosynthesis